MAVPSGADGRDGPSRFVSTNQVATRFELRPSDDLDLDNTLFTTVRTARNLTRFASFFRLD